MLLLEKNVEKRSLNGLSPPRLITPWLKEWNMLRQNKLLLRSTFSKIQFNTFYFRDGGIISKNTVSSFWR